MITSITRQKGISLVSLLIASAIGIFLTGATLKVYLDSKTTFNTRNAVSQVMENQRFALEDMRRILVMTGRGVRGVDEQSVTTRSFPPVGADLSDGGIVFGGSNSDVIAVRYRIGPSCGSYQSVPVERRPTMVRFFVNSDHELICEMTTYDSSGTPSTSESALAANVRLLKVLYGVDDDDDGYADRYLTANMVDDVDIVSKPEGSPTPWSRVVNLRVALVSASEGSLPVSARPAIAPTLNVLGMPYGESEGTDKEHLFRVASATIALRNLHPTVEKQ